MLRHRGNLRLGITDQQLGTVRARDKRQLVCFEQRPQHRFLTWELAAEFYSSETGLSASARHCSTRGLIEKRAVPFEHPARVPDILSAPA
jgi:hypothetical protein